MRINSIPYYDEYKYYIIRDSNKEYKEFLKWMLDNCKNDKKSVCLKKLEYLIMAYFKLVENLENKYNNDYKFFELIRISMIKSNNIKFKHFLEKSKKEYNSYCELDDNKKGYSYYDDLLSWYSFKNDILDEVIDNLAHLSTMDNINKKIEYTTVPKSNSLNKTGQVEWSVVK